MPYLQQQTPARLADSRAPACPVVTTLARLNDRPVGAVANKPKVCRGAMDAGSDAGSARKQDRFMELHDIFHIPLVFDR